MANAAQVLQQAHDLIEAGDYQAARQILDAVRSSNENNPDFWWVYAHAVEDGNEGKAALERVRQLAPNYAGLESIVGGSPQAASPTVKALRPLTPPPPTSSFDDENDDFSDTDEKSEKKQNRLLPILGGMLLVLLVAVIIIAVLNMGNFGRTDTVTPEPTSIVDNFTPLVPTTDSQAVITEEGSETAPSATEEAPTQETEEAAESEESPTQATEEAAETEESPTQEIVVTEEEASPTEEETTATEEVVETEVASEDAFAAIAEELEDFGVPAEGISEGSNSLGESLLITTCATPGPEASQNIIGILDAFKAAGLALETEAITFSVTDCSDNSLILSLGLGREIVESYWAGDSTAAELLAALRRV